MTTVGSSRPSGSSRPVTWRAWLAALAGAVALALAAARCARDVPLGVAPNSDAASADAGDGAAPD